MVNHPAFAAASQGVISDKELLLYFEDFDCMGERQDAHVIPLKEEECGGDGTKNVPIVILHVPAESRTFGLAMKNT